MDTYPGADDELSMEGNNSSAFNCRDIPGTGRWSQHGSDGSLLYVTNLLSDTVSMIDTNTYSVIATIGVGDDPRDVVVSPSGKYVYVVNSGSGSLPGTVSVINTASRVTFATVTVERNPHHIAVSPDGREVYVTNASSSSLSVIRVPSTAV